MRLNHYARKRQHKREMQKHHARQNGRFDPRLDAEYWCGEISKYNDSRNYGYHYWDRCYLSGPRQYAKYCTNRRIRNHYRMLVANDRLSEIIALRGSDYEKEFDYMWTVW